MEKLNYETCKKRHYELWDFVVDELEAAKIQAIPIPNIQNIKKTFFNIKKYAKPRNLCFACHEAEQRFERITESSYVCDFCPLSIGSCASKYSQFGQLWDCGGTMDYDKAISLSREIRDSWEEL